MFKKNTFEMYQNVQSLAQRKIYVHVSYASHEEQEECYDHHEWLRKHENWLEVVVNLPKSSEREEIKILLSVLRW